MSACHSIMSVCLSIMSSCRSITISHHACLTFNYVRYYLPITASSRLSCTRFENGVEGNSRCERFRGKRRKLSTSINIVEWSGDILRSPCRSRDHPQQLPAHRYVGSVQVPATSEKEELQEMARLFPFYSQGASASKVSSRQPFKRFRPSASSNGPQKSFKPKETWTHTFICLMVNQTSCSAFKIGESKRSRSGRKENYFR